MISHRQTLENTDPIHWYVLYTRPRAEKKVFGKLESLGFEVYLPLIPSIRVWSDRKRKVHIPLIPGFIFIHTQINALLPVLQCAGVVRVLCHLGKPAKVRLCEIDNLKILMKDPSVLSVTNMEMLKEGEEIEVIRGPFVGLTGYCIRYQGKHRVVVKIESLGSIVEVNIPLSFLEKRQMSIA